MARLILIEDTYKSSRFNCVYFILKSESKTGSLVDQTRCGFGCDLSDIRIPKFRESQEMSTVKCSGFGLMNKVKTCCNIGV